MKCNTLQVKLFVLQDPLKSFQESNRKYLRTVSFGVIDEKELACYNESQRHVEPLLLYKWWDDKLTYYEMKYRNYDEYVQLVDEDDQFKRFFKSPYFDANEVASTIQQRCKRTQQRMKDPDGDYFQLVNSHVYIDYEQRHALEQECPLVYGQYTITQEYGCPHSIHGAYLYCDKCRRSYGCIICHNNDCFDHQIDGMQEIQALECCQCHKIQNVSASCEACGLLFSNCFCKTCKNIQILDPESEPYYHCVRCGVCHIGAMEGLTKYCEKCKKCVAISKYKGHICADGCDCPVCFSPIYSTEDYVTLLCSQRHKMHESCYQQYIDLSQQAGTCPICKKCILSVSEKLLWQRRSVMILQRITFPHSVVYIAVYKCQDCGTSQAGFPLCVCRSCWLTNCSVVGQYACLTTALAAFMRGGRLEAQVPAEHMALFSAMRDDYTVAFRRVFGRLLARLWSAAERPGGTPGERERLDGVVAWEEEEEETSSD